FRNSLNSLVTTGGPNGGLLALMASITTRSPSCCTCATATVNESDMPPLVSTNPKYGTTSTDGSNSLRPEPTQTSIASSGKHALMSAQTTPSHSALAPSGSRSNSRSMRESLTIGFIVLVSDCQTRISSSSLP